MRLSITFLSVLVVSALMTSFAAWGITYSTSYKKVSVMAMEFTELARWNLNTFGLFVTDLLGINAGLVDTILYMQEESGAARTRNTTVAMTQTFSILANYTTNATEQMQQQMNAVVDTFSHLMDTVVTDFLEMTSECLEEVRNNFAERGSEVFVRYGYNVERIMRRLQRLIDTGVADLTQDPTNWINEADCTLLSVICTLSNELGGTTIVLPTDKAKYYECGPWWGAQISFIWGDVEYFLIFEPTSAQTMYQRCIASQYSGVGGSWLYCPPGCKCGSDPRCYPYYQGLENLPYRFVTNVFYHSPTTPWLHTQLTLFDTSADPPAFLGVLDSRYPLVWMDYLLSKLTPFLASASAYLVLLLNNTNFDTIVSLVKPCASGETPPGNPALPLRTGFRSCDPGVRQVSQYLDSHRWVTEPFMMEVEGWDWKVFPKHVTALPCFLLVGTNRLLYYQAINASSNLAAARLNAVRRDLLQQVAASGLTTQAYLAQVGAQNILATQAMQDSFVEEIQALENSSRTSLLASQAQSNATVQRMMQLQAAAVEAQKAHHLRSMAITSGWTIAVVCAILFVVLLFSAWGTIRVTTSLLHIIGVMEDVVDMRVENLEVPQTTGVAEVSRIQTALQVLVRRLAHYKSYIPAGLFEPLERSATVDESIANAYEMQPLTPSTSTRSSTSTPTGHKAKRRRSTNSLGAAAEHKVLAAPCILPLSPSAQQSGRRNVAVLTVNVTGFMNILLTTNEAIANRLFNDYITHVYETVSQGRGNIDCILGDQVFVTFNAHIPCSDPAGAAAVAALDVRDQLTLKEGGQLKFQIGLSFGLGLASSVGYTKFKSMVTVGSPMKLSSLLCRMAGFDNATILIDANLEERLKYSFQLRPVELVHLPLLKSFNKKEPKSRPIFLLLKKKSLQEDEWLYLVDEGSSDWNRTFDQLVASKSMELWQSLLQEYLTSSPNDQIAQRLMDRFILWVPGLGIPL